MRKVFCTAAVVMLMGATMSFAQTAEHQAETTMGPKSMVADKLTANENKLMAAVKAKDAKAFSSLVKAGAWSVDEGGYMPVDEFTKALSDPKSDLKIDSMTISEMKVIDIDATSAIVTYKLDQSGSFMGQPFPATVYATTVWANNGGTWRAVFHQESTAAQQKK